MSVDRDEDLGVVRDEYLVAWECIVSSYVDTASLCRLSIVSRWFERLVVRQYMPKTPHEQMDYCDDVLKWGKPTQESDNNNGLLRAIHRSFNALSLCCCGPDESKLYPWFPLSYAYIEKQPIHQSMPFQIEWMASHETLFVEDMLKSQYTSIKKFVRAVCEFKKYVYTTNAAGERVLRRSHWFPRFSAIYVIACCVNNTHPYLAASLLDVHIADALFRAQAMRAKKFVFERQQDTRIIAIPCAVDASVYTVTMPEQRSRVHWQLLKQTYAHKMAHVATLIRLGIQLHAMNQKAMTHIHVNGGGIASIPYSYRDLYIKALRKTNRHARDRFGINVKNTSTIEEVALQVSQHIRATMIHEYAYASKHLTCTIPLPRPYIDVHNVISHGAWYNIIDQLHTYWDARMHQKKQTYIDMARDGYQRTMDAWTTRSKRRKRTLDERVCDTRAAAAEVLHSRPAKKQKTMKQQTLE